MCSPVGPQVPSSEDATRAMEVHALVMSRAGAAPDAGIDIPAHLFAAPLAVLDGLAALCYPSRRAIS